MSPAQLPRATIVHAQALSFGEHEGGGVELTSRDQRAGEVMRVQPRSHLVRQGSHQVMQIDRRQQLRHVEQAVETEGRAGWQHTLIGKLCSHIERREANAVLVLQPRAVVVADAQVFRVPLSERRILQRLQQPA
jgi:hypothetical protein